MQDNPPRDEWIRRYTVRLASLTSVPDLRQIQEEAPDVWCAAAGEVSPEVAAELAAEQARLLGGG